MSEQNDETQPVTETPPVAETSAAAPADAPPSAPTRLRWRERAYGIKGLAAVALAGLIIGGGAGAAIHAATGDDNGGRDGRPGFGQHGGRGDGFAPGGPRPGPGQLPQPPNGIPAPPNGAPQQPATPPEDGATPDGSGDASGSGDQT